MIQCAYLLYNASHAFRTEPGWGTSGRRKEHTQVANQAESVAGAGVDFPPHMSQEAPPLLL